MTASLPPAIFLMGPTASGKTQLAMELATRLPIDLISVDSAQVFRDMDIGTAKPDAATLARFPHRLIDIASPEERYSAAQFRSDALREMAEISAHGRIPLLVGGTMLYFKALREGLADLPAADPALRAEIDALAAARGWPAIHAELARLDPASAARLQPTDAQRLQRALEIVRLSGQPVAALYAAQRQTALPYRLLALALVPSERSVLHQRIAARFDEMLHAGLIEEVRMLREKYALDASLPAMRCVGYRQVWEMLEGRLPERELRERGIYATRQLAKRQLTWLRSMAGIETFDPLAADCTDAILQRVRRFLD
ncbi:delta(2)-isopentenylpyrophosphate tRNA-adenosine transferase [Sterolibacterium denitrificans]|uniref:tRNA dimethylallyltransferase n=1 Tax=Sterolibacterium denitrificans TaxID=157592 RepID=A0A7Z7HS24_9PROT|nr:tRNA (adenosine(37)-N6)-dimethylallyltransferase MiaA [Sterolibacterium denitrificans]SMB26567.1 delta(2)-isopentenylpyrophosphate tRNA-adenosine transferase [Sterolibacterium denitrificans]